MTSHQVGQNLFSYETTKRSWRVSCGICQGVVTLGKRRDNKPLSSIQHVIDDRITRKPRLIYTSKTQPIRIKGTPIQQLPEQGECDIHLSWAWVSDSVDCTGSDTSLPPSFVFC